MWSCGWFVIALCVVFSLHRSRCLALGSSARISCSVLLCSLTPGRCCMGFCTLCRPQPRAFCALDTLFTQFCPQLMGTPLVCLSCPSCMSVYKSHPRPVLLFLTIAVLISVILFLIQGFAPDFLIGLYRNSPFS